MEKVNTGAVDSHRLKELLRSLDAENPEADILESIDEMLVQMAVAEGGGGAAIRSSGGIPFSKPGIAEEIADRFFSVKLATTPAPERRLIIEDMLKLLCESGG